MHTALTPIPLLFLLLASLLPAQDARTVVEPTLPPTCVVLEARLTTPLAAASEDRLDTTRIQQVLDTCGRGHAVVLRATNAADAFLSGPLELRAGVTLIVAAGVTLFASRDPALFAESPGSCGVVDDSASGCKPFIGVRNVTGAGIMGDGIIDGQGGQKILGRPVSWWDLAEQARSGGRQQVPRLIVADHADRFTLYRITLRNSPNFHVVYNHGDGLTVWGVKIDTPKRGARNTDGVDPGNGSKDITIAHSFIRTGDDNIALKGGPGGISNVTIADNHFYWGHGMSIGSETNGGVRAIRVIDLSLDGPDNGLRIKSNGSRGGLVEDVFYDDVCIRNSANPIVLDTGYTAAGTVQGSSPPDFRAIAFHNIRISGGGKLSFNGYDRTHRVGTNLDGVLVNGDESYTYSIHHADLVFGPGPVNLRLPVGTDSSVTGQSRSGTPASCADKFIPFPEK